MLARGGGDSTRRGSRLHDKSFLSSETDIVHTKSGGDYQKVLQPSPRWSSSSFPDNLGPGRERGSFVAIIFTLVAAEDSQTNSSL